MQILYDTVLHIVNQSLNSLLHFPLRQIAPGKPRLFAEGQKTVREKLADSIIFPETDRLLQEAPIRHAGRADVIWIHASSLGEYNIARPLIRHIRQQHGSTIVLTLFSPTALQELSGRPEEVDLLLPLPLDTKPNVRRFLDQVHPSKAIFMVSEYWVNYLLELHSRNIPAYLVSTHISGHEPFFRWYGKLWRRAISTFSHIFVLDEASRQRLHSIGVQQTSVCGDPLMDNAVDRASTLYHNPIVHKFTQGADVFIAGSLHNDRDLQLIATLANRHPETRFLIVPHEISQDILFAIMRRLEGKARLFSECTEQTRFDDTQTLIIDFMGALAYLYRYARWAYVGGGFTPYLHSILEPIVYGLPVAFGPQVERKPVAQELMDEGIGQSVHTAKELDTWFTRLQADQCRLQQVKNKAEEFVRQRQNSTAVICRYIES